MRLSSDCRRQGAGDFLVLNAEDKPTQMVALKAGARSDARLQIFWFSGGRRPIKQGAFVHGESVLFVAREGAKGELILPVSEIPLKGSHNVEVCAGGGVWLGSAGGVPAEVIRGAVSEVQGGGASAGVGASEGCGGVL